MGQNIAVIALDAINTIEGAGAARAQALRPYGICDLLTVAHKDCIRL